MSTPDLQRARAEYALSKYLHLCRDESQPLAENAAIRGPLRDCIELSVVRLGVYGIFLILTDDERLHFIAGGHEGDADDRSSKADFEFGDLSWLHIEGTDRATWKSLVQEIIAAEVSEPSSDIEKAFSIPDLKRDPRTSSLSSVTGLASFSFLGGVPLASKCGHKIGALCIVDRSERSPLSTTESAILFETARRCMGLLELARQQDSYTVWTALQEELNVFLRSDTLRTELLEDLETPGRPAIGEAQQSRAKDGSLKNVAEEPLSGLGDPPIEGEESQRVVDAEIERDHRIAANENAKKAPSLTACGYNDDPGLSKGATTYRKVFQRAAECLRTALGADGVLFVDGLIGFHGEVQPVAEPEQELAREISSRYEGDKDPSENGQLKSSSDAYNTGHPISPGTHRRIFTSTEYLRGIYIERPAEVLGFCGSREDLKMHRISQSTVGLPDVDETFLQRLIDRHPDGAIWYAATTKLMRVKNETLLEIDLDEEACRLASVFQNAKQLLVKPLTDPTSRKRLGACIAWRTKPTPVFTDIVDLRSMRAFMHVVECEIARHDATHVAKQKETFVSSVSHELRTPLHGILGAVQLLSESRLDHMQKSLAEMITTCGSTLHETLTSVLSYAKINQFERRQHEYRERHPPDTVWALTEKEGLASGPDRDYEGLYICANLAMLCEEILGVLEAGKSFHSPHAGEVIVVCNIEHAENWTYHTEPGAFRRIAVNLIGNALKYTKSGSVVVTLSADKKIKDHRLVSNDLTTGRTLTLTVEDTGKGMSKDFMDNQLFLPFSQEDSTSTHGVGLGMSIVKSLVSLLGGEIEVRSNENKGTAINVRVPMRMCSPNAEDKGEAAAKFDHDIQVIRKWKLGVVIYGFPQYVRDSLTNYLCHWFDCSLLEPTSDARPDIVLVDEGNEEVLDAVKETAKGYGKRGVLLSIVMVPSKLGKKMDTIDGYTKWERVPRPLGPNNVAKGLLSCLEKLEELQKYGENASVDKQETEERSQPQKDSNNLRDLQRSLPSEGYMPSLDKLKISETPQSSSTPPETSRSLVENAESSTKENSIEAVGESSGRPEAQKVEKALESALTIRILIVDDNALNLRLLGAFFTKNGYRNVKRAKDGREAVEAVQASDHGIDIIFMDLSMPVMDGFEATRQIRAMEDSHKCASVAQGSIIIALTGLASQEDEDGAFDAGVDLFLTKPVQFSKLSNLLHKYEEGSLRRRGRPV